MHVAVERKTQAVKPARQFGPGTWPLVGVSQSQREGRFTRDEEAYAAYVTHNKVETLTVMDPGNGLGNTLYAPAHARTWGPGRADPT